MGFLSDIVRDARPPEPAHESPKAAPPVPAEVTPAARSRGAPEPSSGVEMSRSGLAAAEVGDLASEAPEATEVPGRGPKAPHLPQPPRRASPPSPAPNGEPEAPATPITIETEVTSESPDEEEPAAPRARVEPAAPTAGAKVEAEAPGPLAEVVRESRPAGPDRRSPGGRSRAAGAPPQDPIATFMGENVAGAGPQTPRSGEPGSRRSGAALERGAGAPGPGEPVEAASRAAEAKEVDAGERRTLPAEAIESGEVAAGRVPPPHPAATEAAPRARPASELEPEPPQAPEQRERMRPAPDEARAVMAPVRVEGQKVAVPERRASRGEARREPPAPRVHIGTVEVVVLAPEAPKRAPGSAPAETGLASRRYLRRL